MSKHNFAPKAALGLSLATLGGLSLASFASAASTTIDLCSALPSAVASAASGDTIVLGLDCTQVITVASGQNLTLDLNGHRLSTYSDADVLTVESGATLTLTDNTGTGVLKAGNPNYRALNNAGTVAASNLTIWGDIENSGSLNLESITLDPDDYFPYPTYIIENSGTLTTSGLSANNLFKSTPIYNDEGTVELTAATFTSAPDESLVKEGYEVQEIDGKFVIVKQDTPATNPTENPSNNTPTKPTETIVKPTQPSEEQETPTDNPSETPADQTGDEIEEPVEPLGETHTEVAQAASVASPAVPNTGDKEESKEASSSSIDFLLLAFALGSVALLATVFVKSKAAKEEIVY